MQPGSLDLRARWALADSDELGVSRLLGWSGMARNGNGRSMLLSDRRFDGKIGNWMVIFWTTGQSDRVVLGLVFFH